MTQRTCAECGTTFPRPRGRSQAQWARMRCCCPPCANAQRARNSIGAGAQFKGGPEHGARIMAGRATSPYWQEVSRRKEKREAKRARQRSARRAARDQRAQLSLLPRQCGDCARPIGSGMRYCAACAEQRKREQRKRWNQENPDYIRLYKRAYKVLLNGVVGTCSQEQARGRYDFYGGCCAYCRVPLGPFDEGRRSWHWDHVIPLSRCGTNWPANLRPSCSRCNQQKCAQSLAQYTRR